MKKQTLPTIEQLLESGVHFGHQVKRWHPKMAKYIYGSQKNVHIIDLESTMTGLKTACEFMYESAKAGKQIVFVGTKKQVADLVAKEAIRCGAMYVSDRWLGGTLTNSREIKKNVQRLLSYLKEKEAGTLDRYTKKERLLIDREIEKLQKSVGGIVNLTTTTPILFVIDVKREKTAIKEAKSMGGTVVALVDTNSDPSMVDYIIPGNDDAIKSVTTILGAVADSVEKGYLEKEKAKKDE